jgi:hypothetical protein
MGREAPARAVGLFGNPANLANLAIITRAFMSAQGSIGRRRLIVGAIAFHEVSR